MWTDEARESLLIAKTVKDPIAQMLLYQARVSLELFQHSSTALHEALDTLNFHDFARTQSCHMTEGIFGTDVHLAEMDAAKIRVVSFLLSTTTSGNRFTRSIIAARDKDTGTDWKALRLYLKQAEKRYRRVRNFLEHLDGEIVDNNVKQIDDCKFSRYGKFIFKDDEGRAEFDFTETALNFIPNVYRKIISMLKAREPKRQ